MSFIDRLNEVKPCDPADYLPFYVDGIPVGMMTASFAHSLADFPDTFTVSADRVTLSPALSDPVLSGPDTKTRAVADVLAQLRDRGVIAGWRDELYPVSTALHTPSLFDMERAAAGHFGIQSHAISLNGFVRRDDGLHLWIARRAMTKATYPGEMDLMVGGGHPAGIELHENLIKECHEEAGVDRALAETAVPVGGISFCSELCGEVIDQFQFIYDLEVPDTFTPQNVDGEVDDFYLWPVREVMETIQNSNAFMFDSALVIIDFLIRHGLIGADHPEYSALVLGLRQPSPTQSRRLAEARTRAQQQGSPHGNS